jgi:hypothetical protein
MIPRQRRTCAPRSCPPGSTPQRAAGRPRALIAQYAYDEKTFGGFVFPTRRLIHRRDAEGIADQSFAPITVNVYSVRIERA